MVQPKMEITDITSKLRASSRNWRQEMSLLGKRGKTAHQKLFILICVKQTPLFGSFLQTLGSPVIFAVLQAFGNEEMDGSKVMILVNGGKISLKSLVEAPPMLWCFGVSLNLATFMGFYGFLRGVCWGF